MTHLTMFFRCDYLSKLQFTTHLSHPCLKNSFLKMKNFKLVTWYPNMVHIMWNDSFNIPSTFINIKNHLNYFWHIFVFLNTHVHYTCFHKYIPISHFIMEWNNLFSNLLPRLYSNIICKNIVKIFQKFEVGYIQTCTSLESSTMWHPKGGDHSVFSP
jgi:hypothetical protein